MSKKAITGLIFSLSLAQSAVYAQGGAAAAPSADADAREGASLERMEGKLDKVLDISTQSKKAFIDQPLGARQHGIELNLFRFLLWDEGEKSMSGTYSRFDTDKNVEIAMPFMYSSGPQDEYFWDDDPAIGDLESYTVDLHYRKYLGHRLEGFYLSGFSRLAHLNGTLEASSAGFYDKGSETKLGVGFGIGYRVFSPSGLYWGMSLSLGRYLTGESDAFLSSDSSSADLDDESLIVDVEFFKFGYAF